MSDHYDDADLFPPPVLATRSDGRRLALDRIYHGHTPPEDWPELYLDLTPRRPEWLPVLLRDGSSCQRCDRGTSVQVRYYCRESDRSTGTPTGGIGCRCLEHPPILLDATMRVEEADPLHDPEPITVCWYCTRPDAEELLDLLELDEEQAP